MTDAADLDEHETAGERMFTAIREYVASVYDGEPCVVTRFVVAAEADDGEARWVEVAAFGADGHALAEWESLGLIEYAKRVERGDFAHACSEEDDDD